MRVYTRQFSEPVADLGAGPDTSNKPPKHESDHASDAHHHHQDTDAVTQRCRSTHCGADPDENEEDELSHDVVDRGGSFKTVPHGALSKAVVCASNDFRADPMQVVEN